MFKWRERTANIVNIETYKLKTDYLFMLLTLTR